MTPEEVKKDRINNSVIYYAIKAKGGDRPARDVELLGKKGLKLIDFFFKDLTLCIRLEYMLLRDGIL